MEIRIFDTPAQCGNACATLIAAQIIKKEDSILGLATGSTPIPTYNRLVEMYQQGIIDFSKCRSFNLDEYVGIPEDHPCSYHRFMRDNLFDRVNIDIANTHVPNGNASDLQKETSSYDKAIIDAGGIDVQLLGIGRNGHIGFNEPGEKFITPCHEVTLTESTIEANKRFFDSENDVPRKAVSLGIGAIMRARCVVLVATGKDKAQAIHDTVKGEITPDVQASILQAHPNAILFIDKEAASML